MVNLKRKAIFMIFLILTLPIYSALVYGQITRVSVGGSTGIDKYTKSGDTVVVKVMSTTNQIAFYEDIHTPYDCEAIPNSTNFFCVFSTPIISYTDILTKTITLINYNNGAPILTATYPFGYAIDSAKPNITFEAFQDKHDEGKVKLNLEINDTMTGSFNTFGSYGACSGIRSIKLYDNGAESQEIPINALTPGAITGCMFKVQNLEISIDEGEHNIYLVVEDNAGNIAGSQTQKIVNDQSPPSISGNFELLRLPARTELHVLSDLPRDKYSIPNVIIKLTIDDANLDVSSVYVDAKELNMNPVYSSYYGNLKMTCFQDNGSIYDCYSSTQRMGLSSGIKLNPISNTMNIVVKATDVFGNNATKTSTKTVNLDSNNPKINNIITPFCDGNKCFINDKPTTISFVTPPFGEKTLYGRLLTIDTSGLIPIQRVDSCGVTGDIWTCALNVTAGQQTEGKEYSVSLTYPSVDDLGIKFEPASTVLTYDSKGPEIKDVTFTSDTQETWYLPNEFLQGDRLSIKAIVKDDLSGAHTGFADFSSISPGNKAVEANSCTQIQSTSEYECVWNDAVQATISGQREIKIKIYDYANNSVEVSETLSILKVSDQEGNFFSFGNYQTIPDKIDLVTLPYFPADSVTSWVKQELVATSGAVALRISLTDSPGCGLTGYTSNSSENITKAFNGAKFFRNTRSYSNGDNTLLSVGLNKVSLTSNSSLDYSCPVSIISKMGGTLYMPQKVNMTFTLKTFTSQYVADQTLLDEIEAMKEDLRDGEIIDTLSYYMEWLKTICYAWGVIEAIVNLWYLISTPITAVMEKNAVTVTPATAWKGMEIGVGEALEGIGGEYFEWICAFADCSIWQKIADGELNGGDGEDDFNCASEDPGLFCTILTTWVKVANTYAGNFGQDTYTKDLTGDTTNSYLASASSMSGTYYDLAKKSYVYSILFFCIPGFIYNLKQERNIDCQYVYCVENEVVENGMHVYACDARKAYAECLFTQGQLFNSLPFASLINSVGNIIDMFASNPMSMVGVAFAGVCYLSIFESYTLSLCTIVKNFTKLISSIMTIMDAFDWWEAESYVPAEDYCEKIDL